VADGLLGLDYEFFFGGGDYKFLPGDESFRADTYSSARIAYSGSSFSIGGQYLINGYIQEKGWSADLAANIWNGDIRFEWGQLLRDRGGRWTDEFRHNEPTAWMASADIWRGSNWKLTGFASSTDAEYDVFYSSINPYYEHIARQGAGVPWEKWLRNPLAMPNTQVLGGSLDFQLGKLPFKVVYYDLEDRGSSDSSWWYHNSAAVAGGWSGVEVPYDALMAASLGLPLTDGVNATLTYARQNANYAGLDDLQLLQVGVALGF